MRKNYLPLTVFSLGTVFLLTCDSAKAACRAVGCKLRRDSIESSLLLIVCWWLGYVKLMEFSVLKRFKNYKWKIPCRYKVEVVVMIYSSRVFWHLIAKTPEWTNASDSLIFNECLHSVAENKTLLSLSDISTMHEVYLHLKAAAIYYNTTNIPAQKLVSLWQVWIIILKPFRIGVNLVAICLLFVSSLAEMIWKADVLLLENRRYTSKLPYCLYLQMKLELPPIVFVVCPIVPNWRILYSLLISNKAMAFSRWNCF